MFKRFLNAGSFIGMLLVVAWAWLSIPSNIPGPIVIPSDDAYERDYGEIVSITTTCGWPLIYESREYKRGVSQPEKFRFLPFLALNILEIGFALFSVGYLSQKYLANAQLGILIAAVLCAMILYYIPFFLSSSLVAKVIHAIPIPVAALVWWRSTSLVRPRNAVTG